MVVYVTLQTYQHRPSKPQTPNSTRRFIFPWQHSHLYIAKWEYTGEQAGWGLTRYLCEKNELTPWHVKNPYQHRPLKSWAFNSVPISVEHLLSGLDRNHSSLPPLFGLTWTPPTSVTWTRGWHLLWPLFPSLRVQNQHCRWRQLPGEFHFSSPSVNFHLPHFTSSTRDWRE